MEFNFKNPKLDLVFKYFEEISKIPRGSGNEKEIKISTDVTDFEMKYPYMIKAVLKMSSFYLCRPRTVK